MRRPSRRFRFFIAAGFAVLLAGSLAGASLLPDRWVEVLDRAGIVLGLFALCISGGLTFAGWLQPEKVFAWFRRNLPPTYHPNQELDLRETRQWLRAALIPVSRYEVAAWILHHLKPEAVALIYTEAELSKAAVARLHKEFADRVRFFPDPEEVSQGNAFRLDAPHDPQECRTLARFFVEELQRDGYEPAAIAVDTTGGTVPMSLGAFQASEETGARSIYVVGNEVNDRGSLVIVHPERPGAGTPVLVGARAGE